MINNILEKFGLKYEDLNAVERETLNSWMESLNKNELTLMGVKTYIESMRDSVEDQLAKTDLNSKQDIFLKARLRNYMLLEALLSSPEKAQKALERAIAGIVNNK